MAYEIHDWVSVTDDWCNAVEANGYDIPPEVRIQVVGRPGVSSYHETMTDAVSLLSADPISYGIDWFKWGGYGRTKDQDFTFANNDGWFDSASGVTRENIGDFMVVEFSFSTTEWKPLFIGRIQGVKRNPDLTRTITAHSDWETWKKRHRPFKPFAYMPDQYISKTPIMNKEYRKLSTGSFYLYQNVTYDYNDYPGDGPTDDDSWPKTFSFWAERGIGSWVDEEKIIVKTWYGRECYSDGCFEDDHEDAFGCGQSGTEDCDNTLDYNCRYFDLCQNFIDNDCWSLNDGAITVYSRGQAINHEWNVCVASGVNWIGRARRSRVANQYRDKGEAYSIHPPHIRYSDVVDTDAEWGDGSRFPFALIDRNEVQVGGCVGIAGPDPDHWDGMVGEGYGVGNAWDSEGERTLWPYWGIRLKGVVSQTNKSPYPGYVQQNPGAIIDPNEVNQPLFPDARETKKNPSIPEANDYLEPWFYVCYSPEMTTVSSLSGFPMASYYSNGVTGRCNPPQPIIAMLHYMASGSRLDYNSLGSTPDTADLFDSIDVAQVTDNYEEFRYTGFDYHVRGSRIPGIQWRCGGWGSASDSIHTGLDETIVNSEKTWETVIKNILQVTGIHLYQSPWGTVDWMVVPGRLSAEAPSVDCEAFAPRFVATLAGSHPHLHHSYDSSAAQASGFDVERDAWDLAIEERDAIRAVDFKFQMLDADQSFGITKLVEVQERTPDDSDTEESNLYGSAATLRHRSEGREMAENIYAAYGRVWSEVQFTTPMARMICNPIDSKYLFRPGAKIHVTDNTQSWAAWCDVVGMDFDIVKGTMNIRAVTCSTTPGTDGCVVTPPYIDFGLVDEWGQRTLAMNIGNPGATQLAGSMVITGTNAGMFSAGEYYYSLAPGEDTTVSVTFAPGGVYGPKGATVSFSDAICYTVELFGVSAELSRGAVAISGDPQGSIPWIEPESQLDVGVQDGPGRIRQGFFIKNVGEGDLAGEWNIWGGRVHGSGGEWAFDLEDQAYDLAEAEGSQFYVVFKPWGPGKYYATMEGTDPMYDIYLYGQAVGWFGPFGIRPSGEIGFGATMANIETGTREVEIRNFVDETLEITINVSCLGDYTVYSCTDATVTLTEDLASTTLFKYNPDSAAAHFAEVTFSTTYTDVETQDSLPYIVTATLFGGAYPSGVTFDYIQVLPGELVFPDTWIADDTRYRDFTVLNLSAVTQTLNWAPNGENEYFWLDTVTAPEHYMDEGNEVLYPGATISGRVGFDPTAAGSFSQIFTIISGEENEFDARILCSGIGLAQDSKCKLYPTYLIFTNVPVGESETQTVTISNTTPVGLEIDTVFDITATGSYVDDWSYTIDDANILGGESTTVSITFSPSRRASSYYQFDPGDSCIHLTCMGQGSAYYYVRPPILDFGQQDFHSEKTLDYVVSNTHNATITVTRALTGDSEFDGAVTDMEIAAESEATGTLTYAPTGDGEHTGLITFDLDGASQEYEMTVTGTAVVGQKPVIALNEVLNFQDVAVGATVGQACVFQNLTATTITLTMSIAGVDQTQFDWSPFIGSKPDCVIPGGGYGYATVTCSPTREGPLGCSMIDSTGQLDASVILQGLSHKYAYSLDPTEMTFGVHRPDESTESSYTITNNLYERTISNVTRTLSGDTGHFTTSTTNINLSSEETETHYVTYEPTGVGSHVMTITFSTSDADAGDSTVRTLRVVGAMVESGTEVPELIITPGTMHFPTTYVGNTVYRDFEVTNLMTVSRTLSIGWDSNAPWAFVEVAHPDYISNSGGTLIEPGQRLIGTWSFTPAGDNSLKEHYSNICLDCTDGATISMQGFDAAHDYGECYPVQGAAGFGVIDCSGNYELPITLYNNYEEDLDDTVFTVTGVDKQYFSIATETGGPYYDKVTGTVESFDSFDIYVLFNPGRSAPCYAGIVSDGICNAITLHGAAQNVLYVADEVLNFGAMVTGTDDTKTFTIYNYGDTTRNVLLNCPSGFDIDPVNTINIAANDSEDVDVEFAPTEVLSYGGTINVRDYTNGVEGRLLDSISVHGQGVASTASFVIIPGDTYAFGPRMVSQTSAPVDFVLFNTGNVQLDYRSYLGYNNSLYFTMETAVIGTLNPGESAIAQISVCPSDSDYAWCILDWSVSTTSEGTPLTGDTHGVTVTGVVSHETRFLLSPYGIGGTEDLWVGGPMGQDVHAYITNNGGYQISGEVTFVAAESSTDGSTWHSATQGNAINPPFAQTDTFDLAPGEGGDWSVWANNGVAGDFHYRAFYKVTASGEIGAITPYADLSRSVAGWGTISYNTCISVRCWD